MSLRRRTRSLHDEVAFQQTLTSTISPVRPHFEKWPGSTDSEQSRAVSSAQHFSSCSFPPPRSHARVLRLLRRHVFARFARATRRPRSFCSFRRTPQLFSPFVSARAAAGVRAASFLRVVFASFRLPFAPRRQRRRAATDGIRFFSHHRRTRLRHGQ